MLSDPPVLAAPAADDVVAAVAALPEPELLAELVPPVEAEPRPALIEAEAAEDVAPVVVEPANVEAGADEPEPAVATQEQTDDAAAWTESAVWMSVQALMTQP